MAVYFLGEKPDLFFLKIYNLNVNFFKLLSFFDKYKSSRAIPTWFNLNKQTNIVCLKIMTTSDAFIYKEMDPIADRWSQDLFVCLWRLLVSNLNWSLAYAYRGIGRLQTLARPALRVVAGGCGSWYVVRNSCCAVWIEFLKTLCGIVLLRARGLRTKTLGSSRRCAKGRHVNLLSLRAIARNSYVINATVGGMAGWVAFRSMLRHLLVTA